MNEIIKINVIHLPKLNNAEYTAMMSKTCILIDEATPEKLGFTTQLSDKLKQNVTLLTDINMQSQTCDETAELAILDKERDDLLVYFLATIRNQRSTPVAEIKQAAESLYNTTKPYLGSNRLPNQQQTQVVEGLIMDMAKPDAKAKVQLLTLEGVLQLLDEKNNAYKTLSLERANTQLANALQSAKSVRDENDVLYDEITTRAFVASVASPSPETKTFVEAMNKLIADTNTAYKQRTAQSQSAMNNVQ